jgi:hypothetical protein
VRALALALFLPLCACSSLTEQRVDHLATAQIAADFDTYDVRRVGILPPLGRGFDLHQTDVLQGIVFTEFSQQAPYEFVPLKQHDLEEVELNESYVRGVFEPRTIIELARRFHFDAMLVVTVIEGKIHDPQRLALSADLVASETGAAIWSGSVNLDASSDRVRRALEAFYGSTGATETEMGGGWELALHSPRMFAQFACWQLAQLL